MSRPSAASTSRSHFSEPSAKAAAGHSTAAVVTEVQQQWAKSETDPVRVRALSNDEASNRFGSTSPAVLEPCPARTAPRRQPLLRKCHGSGRYGRPVAAVAAKRLR